MKKLLFAALLLSILGMLALSKCNAQAFFNMGAGVNAGNKNIFPVTNLAAGFKKQNIVLTAETLPQLNRKSSSYMLYGLTVGYDLNGLQPLIGIYNHFQSSDFKKENKTLLPAFGVNYVLPVNDNGGLYGKVLYCDRSVIVGVGFKVNINLQ